MNNIQNILAFLIIIISTITFIALRFIRVDKFLDIKKIKTFLNFNKYIGLSIEQGKRLHISLGNASISSKQAAASFVALTALENISNQSSLSDKPPIASSGNGDLAVLAQDVMRASYRSMNALDRFSHQQNYLTGPTNYAYIAGLYPIVYQTETSTHLFLGNYGPEIGLITDAARRKGAVSIAGTPSLQGQAAIMACADEAAIGEEYFAVPNHLSKKQAYKTTLYLQDLLRWGVIGFLIIGLVLNMVGII